MFLVHLIDWYHFLVFALPSIFVTSFRSCFSHTIDKVTHRRMHCTRVRYLQLIDDVNRKIVMFNRTLKIAHRRHIQMIKLSMVRNICVSFHQANSIIGNCARLIAVLIYSDNLSGKIVCKRNAIQTSFLLISQTFNFGRFSRSRAVLHEISHTF